MNLPPIERDWPVPTTPATVDPDGGMVIQVPNKKVARLIQLGLSVERRQRERSLRRKVAKLTRRRNRRK